MRLLVGRLSGRRPVLERAARGFLRERPRSYLARVVGDRGFALAAAAALVASTTTTAVPPVNLSDVAAGTGGFVMNGIASYDLSGGSVSSAGDVNGDGLADLIVGAAWAGIGNEGESYVIFGRADTATISLADVAAGTGGFIIKGNDPLDRSGSSVSGAGDVNGDGLADLIVGALSADPGGNSGAGESYVVFSPVEPPACQCELLTATAFGPPMGKKKKIGSTLPIKFQLFFDGVEIVSEEQLNQVLEDNGCTPGCPKPAFFLQDGEMGLPIDDQPDDNVGDPDEGDCFRYSAPNWIYNVRLLPPAFMPGSCYTVEIEIGDDCVLVPDNNAFETK